MSQTKKEYQPCTGDSILNHLENPYLFFKALREQKPISFSPELNAWLVTRYSDVRSIFSQPEIFSSSSVVPLPNLSPAAFAILQQGYPIVPVAINSDGLNHQRFRGSHVKGFSSASMKEHEVYIHALANRLIDAFIEDRHAEFISQFAYPLTMEGIVYLLGVPQDHMEDVKKWGRDMTDLLFGNSLSEERQIECAKGFVAFQHYIAELIEERRAHPKDDEISSLIQHQVPGAPPLSVTELVNSVMGFLTVGHRTTVDLLGSGVLLLLQTPSLWQNICMQPDLIPSAVEETLRYETSVQTISRVTTREVEIGDVVLPEGAVLFLLLGCANRDEQQFPDAGVFDIQRPANRHLAFGHGVHFCLGASAARLEMKIALEALTRRLSTLRLVPDQQLSHNPILLFRGYQKLEVEW